MCVQFTSYCTTRKKVLSFNHIMITQIFLTVFVGNREEYCWCDVIVTVLENMCMFLISLRDVINATDAALLCNCTK